MGLKNLILWVFLLTSALTFAQQTVTGSVKDSAGKPVVGATVLVVGTSRNATTNSEGMYAIEAQGEETLQFTAQGYQNVERKVDLETTIDVILALNSEDAKKVGALGVECYWLYRYYSGRRRRPQRKNCWTYCRLLRRDARIQNGTPW